MYYIGLDDEKHKGIDSSSCLFLNLKFPGPHKNHVGMMHTCKTLVSKPSHVWVFRSFSRGSGSAGVKDAMGF